MKQFLALPSQAGPILRKARKSAGLNQGAVAKRLGISQKRISAMEINPASINLEQFLTLCSLLGLELLIQTKTPDRPTSGISGQREAVCEA